MKFETVEIKDLGKVSGTVPATLHYHEDQQVHLRIIDESPATADASVLKEALGRIESAEVPEEEEFTFDPIDFISQLKGIARKALAQYNTQSPSPSSGVGHLIDYLKKIEAICIRDAGNVDKMQEDFKAIFRVCQSALSGQSLPAPSGSQEEQREINKLQEQNFELAKGVMELMKVQKILAKVSGLGILSHTLQQHEKAIDDLLEEYHNLKRSQSTLPNQSPSSIEESGLKEGEVTCVFCETPCEPAPTKRGWSSVRHGKGLHFDCAGKVCDQGNAIGMKELEDLGKDPLS